MRAIKAAMTARRFDLIPGELRSMIRVWVGTSVETGLRRRRLDEAKLFEDGLASHPQQVGV
jgi:GH24 family phage-related lysozyme (muramidase)